MRQNNESGRLGDTDLNSQDMNMGINSQDMEPSRNLSGVDSSGSSDEDLRDSTETEESPQSPKSPFSSSTPKSLYYRNPVNSQYGPSSSRLPVASSPFNKGPSSPYKSPSFTMPKLRLERIDEAFQAAIFQELNGPDVLSGPLGPLHGRPNANAAQATFLTHYRLA